MFCPSTLYTIYLEEELLLATELARSDTARRTGEERAGAGQPCTHKWSEDPLWALEPEIMGINFLFVQPEP